MFFLKKKLLMQGVISTAICYWLLVWVVEKKGPVFGAVFSPLSLIITAIFSAILLQETLHWGRSALLDPSVPSQITRFLNVFVCFAVFLELCCWFWGFMGFYGGRLRKQKWR